MADRMTIERRPLPSIVGQDAPLRLDCAAALAFPDGSMTAKGLRKEAARGRLVIERVAGKDYTTLAHIDRMREQCRLKVKAPDSNSDRPAATPADELPIPQPGASSTDDIREARAAADMIVEELSGRSHNTSPRSTSRKRGKGNVIRLASRSPMS